ncbi:MAG: RND family efflux transporter MFP subunit [Cryomorphaceae bacterium]
MSTLKQKDKQPKHDRDEPEFVDRQKWQRLAQSENSEEFFSAWLDLQCTQIDSVRTGILLAETQADKTFSPAAYWPTAAGVSEAIIEVARSSLDEAQALVIDLQKEYGSTLSVNADSVGVSFPVKLQGHLVCVVALEIVDKKNQDIGLIMRQLQWGVSWLEAFYFRLQAMDDDLTINRLVTSLYMVASSTKEASCKEAMTVFVTELASTLNCERVSCALLQGKHAAIEAVSNSGQFARKMNLVNLAERAMDEAIEQNSVIHYPEEDGNGVITHNHSKLAGEQNGGVILTYPLVADGKNIGAVCIESSDDQRFDDDVVEMCQSIVTLTGPILNDKYLNDLWIGKKLKNSAKTQLERFLGVGYVGRKIAAMVVLAIALFIGFAKGEFRVNADSALQGQQQRALVAPFDGFVSDSYLRVGDRVKKGDIIATLDDTDLRLDLVELSSSRAQAESQYDAALADYNRAEAKTFRAKVDQANARIGLVTEKLKRTKMIAPLDGVIVNGDLSQSLGGAVTRGQAMFEIASLFKYRVALKVDERDISYIEPEQKIELLLSSLPDQTFDLTVDSVTPLTTAGEGRNYFRVEAELDDINGILRPGMEGVAKISVDDRLYIWIWTREMVDWWRLLIWRWAS